MGLFLVLIAFFWFFYVLFNANTPRKGFMCHELKQPHKWVWKDDKYMVCSKCRMLPGGDMEEGN